MQITHNNMIAGLNSKGTEFFALSPSEVTTIHNRQILPFEKSPKKIIDIVKSVMPVSTDDMDLIKRFVFERWGALDNTPDICENGIPSDPEYIEGVSVSAYFDNGVAISPGQLRVLKLIKLPPVEIADKLFLSKQTVDRHIQDMLRNGGFINTKALAIWAVTKITRVI